MAKKYASIYGGYKNWQTWNVAWWIEGDWKLQQACASWKFQFGSKKLKARAVRDFVAVELAERGVQIPLHDVKWSEVAKVIDNL